MALRFVFCSLFSLPLFLIPVLAAEPADPSTLTGKVMSGYQGWFRAEGDGSERGFTHYGTANFGPNEFAHVEMWPDMSEMDDDEKYPTPFKHADGSTAYVFSSMNRKTVVRHFQWMEEYGIDGVFLQRFIATTSERVRGRDPKTVMDNVRYGAEKHNRAWSVMYDLSGGRPGMLMGQLLDDWKKLVDEEKVLKDRMYLHHKGKPVVTLWGIGFNDNRPYTLSECLELVTFLKDDPKYGGNTVMVGVPAYWREQRIDTVSDPMLHEIIRKADIVHPWMPGRLHSLEDVDKYIKNVAIADMAWCKENNVEYIANVYPGFSWYNLEMSRGRPYYAVFNQQPRLKGKFLSAQLKGYMEQGVTMIYQSMFDEIDEATAIFKTTDNPPVGGVNKFLDMEGLPSDFYLKLLGEAAKELKQRVKQKPVQ